MQRLIRIAAGCGLVAMLAAALPLAAAAHEHRDIVDGQYSVVVGFLDEPAFAGEKNGLSLSVAKHDPAAEEAEGEEEEGTPVLGLDQTLQAEVIYGDQTMALALSPAFGEPGAYESVFFPMAEGDYTFRIFGDLEGNAIDESFTSSPEGFDSVQPREPLEFPKTEASVDGAVAATLGGDAGGFPGGPVGALLVGLVALAGVGIILSRRFAARWAPAPVAARG